MWKEKETDVVFEEVRDSKAEGKSSFLIGGYDIQSNKTFN